MKKLLTFATLMLSTAVVSHAQPSASVRQVSVKEFQRIMDSLQDETVIDLRTPDETQKGKIAGATEIDFYGDDFKSALGALDRSKPYLIYCAGGIRSGKTAEIMKEMGFIKVYDLGEGFKGWARAGMPVAKKE